VAVTDDPAVEAANAVAAATEVVVLAAAAPPLEVVVEAGAETMADVAAAGSEAATFVADAGVACAVLPVEHADASRTSSPILRIRPVVRLIESLVISEPPLDTFHSPPDGRFAGTAVG
jgi:hypothetical protein